MKGAVLLLALACASCGMQAQTQSTRPQQKYEALGHEILTELIALDVTVDRGSTLAAKPIGARAIANGFPPADVTVVTPKTDPTAPASSFASAVGICAECAWKG